MRALLFASFALVPLVACNKENPEFCKTHPGIDGCPDRMDGGNGDGPDADIDADPTIDARLDYGAGAFAILLTSGATSPITLPTLIDTTSNVNPCANGNFWVDAGQPEACFVVATKITVSSAVSVTGSRPLVLVATDTLTVMSTIDVSSHVTGDKLGPGSPFGTCPNFGSPPQTNNMGGGGGAGGSFITAGGSGGKGNNMTYNGGTPSATVTAPGVLRAGCKGQQGGAGGTGGGGGEAGGAIALIAGNTINLSGGGINASGGGGLAASNKAGGGGGGSGGMIVLYSPAIITDNATRLVANGGGGSSGANGSLVGGEAATSTPGTAAPGGGASGGCGNQNGGGVGNTAGGTGGPGGTVTSDTCGGGGGGGGGGYVRANVAIGAGMFSPTPDIIPQ
jgi:hypothetical protein